MPGTMTREQFSQWDLGEPFPGDWYDEESEQEAADRMTPDEALRDEQYRMAQFAQADGDPFAEAASA